MGTANRSIDSALPDRMSSLADHFRRFPVILFHFPPYKRKLLIGLDERLAWFLGSIDLRDCKRRKPQTFLENLRWRLPCGEKWRTTSCSPLDFADVRPKQSIDVGYVQSQTRKVVAPCVLENVVLCDVISIFHQDNATRTLRSPSDLLTSLHVYNSLA